MSWLFGFLAGPWSKIAGYAALGGAAVAGLLALLSGAKKSGVKEQQLTDLQQTVANMEARTDVDRSVAGASDSDVRRKLRTDWTRPG